MEIALVESEFNSNGLKFLDLANLNPRECLEVMFELRLCRPTFFLKPNIQFFVMIP